MDRDELAERALAARALAARAALLALCDALLPLTPGVYRTPLDSAALTPTPPPRESGTGAYVPKVGDVVRFVGPRHGPDKDYEDRVLVRFDSNPPHNDRWDSRGVESNGFASIFPAKDWWSYLRPATASERAAAGLPPAPAPVAERPEWVRVKREAGEAAPYEDLIATDKAYRVTGWDDMGRPMFVNEKGRADTFLSGCWLPSPPPPPADARGEAFKALLAYAECDNAYCYVDDPKWQDVFRRHGWIETTLASDWLEALCHRALALARKAEGGAA